MVKSILALSFYLMGSVSLALAQTAPVPAGSAPAAGGAAVAPQQPGFGSMLMPFLMMFAVVYFLMIRPQQKKLKDQQDMLAALKQGDDVVTNSGILGRITDINEKLVTVEVAERVRVKMLKSQISQVVKGQIKDLAQ